MHCKLENFTTSKPLKNSNLPYRDVCDIVGSQRIKIEKRFGGFFVDHEERKNKEADNLSSRKNMRSMWKYYLY